MHTRRTCLTAIFATIPAAAVMLAAFIASPPDVQLTSDACVGGDVVSACADVDVKVPNVNAVTNAIPDIPVPNINMPNVKVNPGHVGRPGRGR